MTLPSFSAASCQRLPSFGKTLGGVLPGFTGFYLVLLGCFNCGAANRVERNRWKRARRNGARHRSQSRSNRVEKPSKTR